MSEFDIIFAGGGTAACVIAGRLAAVDPSLKILVLESGQHSRDVPRHVQPCGYIEHLTPDGTTFSHYVARPSVHLNGRRPIVSCGRGVGGGSAVNFMLYARGAASDYDGWAALGNEGWSFNELLPFIKKLETFNPIPDRPSSHGYSGPIQISAGTVEFDIGSQFLHVVKEYDPDRPQVDDNNDFVTPNACSPAYRYVDPITGRRSDAASRYLYPHADNPNLTIMVGKRVRRVIIENGRAVAVEYSTAAKSSDKAKDEFFIAKANRLIVVSAGAIGSPGILERSGIGARTVLEENNVDVQVDLPGVGENYQDHVSAFPAFYVSEETETMDDIWSDPKPINEWLESRTAKISHNGIVAMFKLRPNKEQLSASGPALQQRWKTFFERNPDKAMAVLGPFAGSLQSTSRKLLCIAYFILYPDSISRVHITSGENSDSPPDLDTEFLTKECDVAQFTLLYKFTRELVRRMPAYRGEMAGRNPKFPAGSPAACKETDVPVQIDAPNIVYSHADDEAIVQFHRDTVAVMGHALGTCAMKPRDQLGVVDARLNVYGVEGLKVADMSICPTNVGSNTYSTALLIGEKAADIIARDLGYGNT